MCNEIIEIPIDGILDLHTFHPKEVPELLVDYINECIKNNIYDLRIIHGKGKGILQKRVHSLLKKNLFVESFKLAYDEKSSWGATLVKLHSNIKLEKLS